MSAYGNRVALKNNPTLLAGAREYKDARRGLLVVVALTQITKTTKIY